MKVSVVVKPRSKKGPLVAQEDSGSLIVYVREPAIDGKANEAVRKLIAEHFGLRASGVRCVSGATSRHKIYEITEYDKIAP